MKLLRYKTLNCEILVGSRIASYTLCSTAPQQRASFLAPDKEEQLKESSDTFLSR